jgi:nucleotide-binding universal stress UspA family protein
MSDHIVIGVSGRESERAALDWGVAYAKERGLRVELLHDVDTTWAYDAPGLVTSALAAAETSLAHETSRVADEHPDVHVRGDVLLGSPTQMLVARAADARVLVVGTRISGGPEGLRVYSRHSARIAERAECTVVVVPPDTDPFGGSGVVVGVDGSELSLAALRFGADVADRVHETLTAVHAWLKPWPWGVSESTPAAMPPESEVLLAESIAGLAEDFPDLSIARSLPEGPAHETLIAAAEGARLLAVGSHGRGALGRMWFGSVSMELLLRMPCPVAIVR